MDLVFFFFWVFFYQSSFINRLCCCLFAALKIVQSKMSEQRLTSSESQRRVKSNTPGKCLASLYIIQYLHQWFCSIWYSMGLICLTRGPCFVRVHSDTYIDSHKIIRLYIIKGVCARVAEVKAIILIFLQKGNKVSAIHGCAQLSCLSMRCIQ